MANKKSWIATPAKKVAPTVPDLTKSTLKTKADKLIVEVIRPQHVQPAPTDHDFNYIAEITCKWYRNYFCAVYNCPSPNAISPSFEVKFARMEFVALNKFNLAYMRHTEQWFEMFQDLSLDDCLSTIAEDPLFTP